MFTNVSRKFENFKATAETLGDDFQNVILEFEGAIDSINTGSTDRDKHLLSPDFFDSENYPTIRFVSSPLSKIDEGDFKIKGDLTMHGVTKLLEMDTDFGGLIKDPWGNIKAGFSITNKINRKD